MRCTSCLELSGEVGLFERWDQENGTNPRELGTKLCASDVQHWLSYFFFCFYRGVLDSSFRFEWDLWSSLSFGMVELETRGLENYDGSFLSFLINILFHTWLLHNLLGYIILLKSGVKGCRVLFLCCFGLFELYLPTYYLHVLMTRLLFGLMNGLIISFFIFFGQFSFFILCQGEKYG